MCFIEKLIPHEIRRIYKAMEKLRFDLYENDLEDGSIDKENVAIILRNFKKHGVFSTQSLFGQHKKSRTFVKRMMKKMKAEKDETKDTGLVWDEFVETVKNRMGEYEDCSDTKKMALQFYQVLTSTAKEEKYSVVHSDRRFKNVNNILESMFDKSDQEIKLATIEYLIYCFCNRGRCEAQGVGVLRDFKNKVAEKLASKLPGDLKELPIFFEMLVDSINSISQNPVYFDWTEQCAKEHIDNIVSISPMRDFLRA